MNLEGSLGAFGLPDVVTLLATTGKSGCLELRRTGATGSPQHGAVWLRDGRITGASSDQARSSLVRRLVGSGAVDDAALRTAVARTAAERVGVTRALLEAGAVEPELLVQAASDQAVDAVFDLLRWVEGDFGFDQDAMHLDDVGVSLESTAVLAEARARVESWGQFEALVPSPDSVLSLPVVLHHDPEVTRDEWALLALVDGRRRVRDLVDITGAGQFAVTTTLAHLVQRGLVHVRDASAPDHVAVVERRLALLAGIEEAAQVAPAAPEASQHEPAAGPGALGMSAAAALAAARAAQGHPQAGVPGSGQVSRSVAREVVPPRPEPFLPDRRPEHLEPAYAERAASSHSGASTVVDGATARVLSDPQAAAESAIERDPQVNRSLLLRLIAGVRGL